MLKNIPFKVVHDNEEHSVSRGVILAVLNEIDSAITQFVDNNKQHSIDLRSVFRPDQTASLKNLLGQGEVTVKLELGNISTIEETSISGVWWITHFDHEQNKYCEIIEICQVPQLLVTQSEDIAFSQNKLRSIINYAV